MLKRNSAGVQATLSGQIPTRDPILLPQAPSSTMLSHTTNDNADDKLVLNSPRSRRFSFRTFTFASSDKEHNHALSSINEHEKTVQATVAFSRRFIKAHPSNSDKRAKESALLVQSLIIGPAKASPRLTPAYAKPQLNKIKSQLINPKSANKVIAQLRVLPISDGHGIGKTDTCQMSRGPIHAVCLEHTDAEENKLHFAPFTGGSEGEVSSESSCLMDISSVSLDKLTAMFNEMNIIDLVNSPDLGLGKPGDGKGLLAGAVPTAETILKGIEQITPQLMALGYATGQSIFPNHTGVYPPTDRISVLTYWWGLELVLPPPSLQYLANAQSITNAVVNFLSALALINNGVREIIPFVRYIAQFIDFEFNAIRRKDEGRGVVCAATWIMPAAMVPRAWDFPDPPIKTTQPPKGGDSPKIEIPVAKSLSKSISSPLPRNIIQTHAEQTTVSALVATV